MCALPVVALDVAVTPLSDPQPRGELQLVSCLAVATGDGLGSLQRVVEDLPSPREFVSGGGLLSAAVATIRSQTDLSIPLATLSAAVMQEMCASATLRMIPASPRGCLFDVASGLALLGHRPHSSLGRLPR